MRDNLLPFNAKLFAKLGGRAKSYTQPNDGGAYEVEQLSGQRFGGLDGASSDFLVGGGDFLLLGIPQRTSYIYIFVDSSGSCRTESF